MSPNETLFLESTTKIHKDDVSGSSFVNFQIWDFPGQMDFFDPAFDYETIFRGTGALIYVIDAQVGEGRAGGCRRRSSRAPRSPPRAGPGRDDAAGASLSRLGFPPASFSHQPPGGARKAPRSRSCPWGEAAEPGPAPLQRFRPPFRLLCRTTTWRP